MTKVYLAGAICDADNGRLWRKSAANMFKSHGIAPLDPYDFELEGMSDKEIVETDLDAISGADYVLANIGIPSWGTGMEIYYANLHGKPVHGFGVKDLNVVSPWIRFHMQYYFYHMNNAVESIIKETQKDD